ncbi:hypothetical protein PVAG01_05405 [Phlyctema vagabunda]|uniref:BZIP domain-containing protein n=1 Tax=Phlyctema vagabunda TaxID=108571 RepID=A0ABR4PK09_9HELO
MDNSALFSYDLNAFAESADWQTDLYFQDPKLPETYEAPQDWYSLDAQTVQWPASEYASSSASGESPGECSPPRSIASHLIPTHNFASMSGTINSSPTISVGIVTAADRKAATKRRRQQQNRDAQRTFRQRRQEEFEKLGTELEKEKQKRVSCEAEVERLQRELNRIRRLVGATRADEFGDNEESEVGLKSE